MVRLKSCAFCKTGFNLKWAHKNSQVVYNDLGSQVHDMATVWLVLSTLLWKIYGWIWDPNAKKYHTNIHKFEKPIYYLLIAKYALEKYIKKHYYYKELLTFHKQLQITCIILVYWNPLYVVALQRPSQIICLWLKN